MASRSIAKVKVPTYLAFATFDGIDENERENTYKHISKLKKYKHLPITYRSVNSGHYVHWSDRTLLSDLRDFLDGDVT